MPDSPPASPEIALLTLAATHIARMVAFYNAVLDARLEPFEAYGTTLFEGHLGGISFIICPNEVLGVRAENNRMKFEFFVTDIDSAVRAARRTGGDFYGQNHITTRHGIQVASLTDPDGNTLVLRERSNRQSRRS